MLINELEEFESYAMGEIYLAVRAGNRKLAGYLVEKQEEHGGWGFNFLHKQALNNTTEDFDEFKYVVFFLSFFF